MKILSVIYYLWKEGSFHCSQTGYCKNTIPSTDTQTACTHLPQNNLIIKFTYFNNVPQKPDYINTQKMNFSLFYIALTMSWKTFTSPNKQASLWDQPAEHGKYFGWFIIGHTQGEKSEVIQRLKNIMIWIDVSQWSTPTHKILRVLTALLSWWSQ